jgi:signal transduction histidine kinase
LDVLNDRALPGATFVDQAEVLRRRLVRLACDVHDGPMQSLTAAGQAINQLRRRLDRGEHVASRIVAGELDLILAELAETERDLRALIGKLEHGDQEIDPLDEIVDAEIDVFARRCAIPVDVDTPPGIELDSHSQALAARAVLREALTNVARHARAESVQVRVRHGRKEIVLEVEDDGDGFDPAAVGADRIGLTSMRERLHFLGGSLAIASGPGGPTVVTATLRRWRRA